MNGKSNSSIFFDMDDRRRSCKEPSTLQSDSDDSENMEKIITVMVTDGLILGIEFIGGVGRRYV